MPTPREKALSLCQAVGMTTLFVEDCNNGMMLPLRIAKIIAKIVVKECYAEAYNNNNPESYKYWQEVDKEIDLL